MAIRASIKQASATSSTAPILGEELEWFRREIGEMKERVEIMAESVKDRLLWTKSLFNIPQSPPSPQPPF